MNIKCFKNWWEVWDIQIVTLCSLLLQVVLVFFAPLRKRMSMAVLVFPMWLAYLLADAIPVYAMGLVSRGKSNSEGGIAYNSSDLVVFWAPFFLLHLGGPDTITAFAIEDNELWHRHLLNLVVQCFVFLYAFYLSFPGNKLWLPTLFVFIAGFIKYAERTCSLYRASSRGLRNAITWVPEPGLDYSKLEDGTPSEINLSTDSENVLEIEALSDLQVIRHAHWCHIVFIALLTDVRFSYRQRSAHQNYFLKRNSRDAFKIIEVELNFIYEALYTKVLVVQSKYGFLLRIASFGFIGAALVLFELIDKHKEGYKKFDIGLTYTLLGGAIALDAVSSLMILFSDWYAAVLCRRPGCKFCGFINLFKLKQIIRKLFVVDRQRWPRDDCTLPPIATNQKKEKMPSTFSIIWMMKLGRRTWSESIPQYNLLDYCVRPRSHVAGCAIGFIGLTDIFDSIKYVKSKEFSHDLRDLIFDELSKKSGIAKDSHTARRISLARGGEVLRSEGLTNLQRWTEKVDYDESILLWHIATELLYNTDNGAPNSNTRDCKIEEKYANRGTDSCGSCTEIDYRGLSKILSDYMLYLLIKQTTIMSTVAGVARFRFSDTCAEAEKYFPRTKIAKIDIMHTLRECGGGRKMWEEETKDKVLVEACKRISAVETPVVPPGLKGNGSRSFLFDACMLAKELDKGGEDGDVGEDKWRLISRVWVEMMCYAASSCKGTTHAAQLSKGGQLITLVWLLMAHLGLGDYFQAEPPIDEN